MFKFNKNFGQNFISDEKLINKIVDSACIDKDTLVIEVGPGMGALTKKIVPLSGFSVIYEIDDRLEGILNSALEGNDNYKLIINDFMNVDLNEEISKYNYGKIVFISNLPYYITSPILSKLIRYNIIFDRIVVMTQKEFAYKLISVKHSGSLDVLLKSFYNITKPFNISKGYFKPVTNVDSALLVMENNGKYKDINDIDKYKKMVKDSFNQKRKSIKNNLKGYDLNIIEEVLKENDNDLSVRAEDIDVDLFIKMANRID